MDRNIKLENEILQIKNIFSMADSIPELEAAVAEVKKIYNKHKTVEKIASAYIAGLLKLYFSLEKEHKQEKVQEEIQRVYNQHRASIEIASAYLSSLVFLMFIGNNSEQEIAIQEAKKVYDQHRFSESFATVYISSLDRFYFKLEESLRKVVAEEAKRVFNHHQFSEIVASEYLMVLPNFSQYQKQSSPMEEAKKVYNQHKFSELVSDSYVSFLLSFSWFIKEKDELQKVVNDIQSVYNRYQFSENIAEKYLSILIHLIQKQEKANEIKKTAQRISDILKNHSTLKNILEFKIDSLILNEDRLQANITKFVNILSGFIEKGEIENPLRQTKYKILFDSLKIMSNEEMNKLIQVFCLVQQIKNKLVVRNPGKLSFCHYTSGKVLQILLKQKRQEKYSIESKSRLNNVNYMNDPSEGKVLDHYLQLNPIFQKSSLKPSSWFLMSLTTAIDQLTMWAQYGNQGEGVCLVLETSDFSEVNSSSDIEWLTSRRSSESKIEELEDSVDVVEQESKDFIYRIGYLTTQSDVDAVLKPEYNTCLADEEIEVINDSLKALKEKVGGIDKVNESALYEKVDECLEEIRYLFKSADYSYESELRVLKYMPLESDNPNIKIDDSGEFAKLYIERENPIKLSEVIFGPKFPNPENVTPLLYLLDKNIEFRQSDISFR